MKAVESLATLLANLPDEALIPVGWVRARLAQPLPVETIGDLSCSDVAEALKRKPGTIRGWCHSGQLEGAYLLHGKDWKIPRESLRAYLDKQSKGLSRHDDAAVDLGAWRIGSKKKTTRG